jgi:carbon monoxide dehydrogenase subunit G
MQLNGSVTFNAPRNEVWEVLTDADIVARCAPGVESVEVVEENVKYKVVASVGFGNIKARFSGDLEFLELVEPSFAKIKGHGTAPGSAADVVAEMTLTDGEEDTTVLDWIAEVTIMGTIASLANRMMGSVTQKLTTDFFNKIKERVDSMEPGDS